MTFAEKLKKAKDKLDLSVQDMAARWDIIPSTLENWMYRDREPRDFELRLRIEKDLEKILKTRK